MKALTYRVRSCAILCLVLVLWLGGVQTAEANQPFTAFDPAQPNQGATISIQHDPAAKTGADWAKVGRLQWFSADDESLMLRAAQYLQEGLSRMTGQSVAVQSTHDLSKGIVLTTLAEAGSDLQADAAVQEALRNTGKDDYNNQEAFFIRSEKDRLLVIANTPDGLLAGAVALLESVGYEQLGLGPNWTHVPDYTNQPLVFNLTQSGRPSYYIRNLWATSGQGYGVGTLTPEAFKTQNAGDEDVHTSYRRWRIGRRMVGKSMPDFPGHALQAHHDAVIAHMIANNTTKGFLAPQTRMGPLSERPEPSEANAGLLWIEPEPVFDEKTPQRLRKPKAYVSSGKEWRNGSQWNLDLSVPFVRQIILEAAMDKAKKHFQTQPDEPLIIGIDAEDGAAGNAKLPADMENPQWYPQYLQAEGLPFGRPYVLHGYNGVNQPTESWDPAAASDHMFALAHYLLHELDKHFDALPEDQQKTPEGKLKKNQVRMSFYSYNYHDVPPSFNPEPRSRVMIAGFPKHRGKGKWEKFASQEDMARAFQVMLPREPSGDYRIISLAYFRDFGVAGIAPYWSNSAQSLSENYRRAYDAGFRAMSMETDFNFGKFGLGYYLITQMLWDTTLTPAALDAIRDRWFQRSFGSGWREMKAYYDFMNPENYPVNGPNTWATAIRLIDAADQKVDHAKEPEAQARIDDVKEYWYYHYLADTGLFTVSSPEFRTFFWKGQMSYMVAMHMVGRRHFEVSGRDAASKVAGTAVSSGPASYTHEETQQWWADILAHWQLTPVTQFREGTLADGTPAGEVDLQDLVMVREFQSDQLDISFKYNSALEQPRQVLTFAHKDQQQVGFVLAWPSMDHHFYLPRRVAYGAEWYNPQTHQWEDWLDINQLEEQSVEVMNAAGKSLQVVRVSHAAPRAGVYRFTVGKGGNSAQLGSLGLDPVTGKVAGQNAFTQNTMTHTLTQEPVWFYIPKGTKTLDLSVWDQYKRKKIKLFKGLPHTKPKLSRELDVSEMKTYTLPLEEGEDGTVAQVYGNGFAFPYLYSTPIYYAKSPRALLVPRKIAEADGLTIMDSAE